MSSFSRRTTSDESTDDGPSGGVISQLTQLDQRQDQVLDQLDQLHRQIEDTLRLWSAICEPAGDREPAMSEAVDEPPWVCPSRREAA